MLLAEPFVIAPALATPPAQPWRAELELGFIRRDKRTVLATRRHEGPLVVQKALYPEGDDTCHAIIVHPPAGIAGGDQLELQATLDAGAQALLTTPGAGKWYRSAGARAQATFRFRLAEAAVLEWLPQETIVFDGALADMNTKVELAASARYLGWEVLCLGRTGSGERFTRGQARVNLEIERNGRPLFIDRARLDGGGRLLDSPAGLDAAPVCATFIAAFDGLDASHLAACRAIDAGKGDAAVTRLPGLIVARYLGTGSEAARAWLTALWSMLRPVVCGRPAIQPRIWRT